MSGGGSKEYGIVLNARYMDDGIIFFDGLSRLYLDFFWEIRKRADFFKVVADPIPSDHVAMLDVRFYRGSAFRTSGILDYIIHYKTTNIWTPLLPSSDHQRSVHSSWPKAMIQRVASRCSKPLDAKRKQKYQRKAP